MRRARSRSSYGAPGVRPFGRRAGVLPGRHLTVRAERRASWSLRSACRLLPGHSPCRSLLRCRYLAASARWRRSSRPDVFSCFGRAHLAMLATAAERRRVDLSDRLRLRAPCGDRFALAIKTSRRVRLRLPAREDVSGVPARGRSRAPCGARGARARTRGSASLHAQARGTWHLAVLASRAHAGTPPASRSHTPCSGPDWGTLRCSFQAWSAEPGDLAIALLRVRAGPYLAVRGARSRSRKPCGSRSHAARLRKPFGSRSHARVRTHLAARTLALHVRTGLAARTLASAIADTSWGTGGPPDASAQDLAAPDSCVNASARDLAAPNLRASPNTRPCGQASVPACTRDLAAPVLALARAPRPCGPIARASARPGTLRPGACPGDRPGLSPPDARATALAQLQRIVIEELGRLVSAATDLLELLSRSSKPPDRRFRSARAVQLSPPSPLRSSPSFPEASMLRLAVLSNR